jgi:cytoskeletal protein CcmA (bactofilin family)
MSNSPSFSVLGSDVAIKGDIAAKSDLHIDGRVEGDITCTSLVQGETSEIFGAIRVASARMAGHVRGTISAADLVILRTARIEGDVEYESLTIEPGAKVDGRLSQRDNQPAEASLEADASGEPHLTLAAIN